MNAQHSPATFSVETIFCHKRTFHLIKCRIDGHSPHKSNIHFFAKKKSLDLFEIFNLKCSKQLHKKAQRSEKKTLGTAFFLSLTACCGRHLLLIRNNWKKRKKKTTMWKRAFRPWNSWDWFSLTQRPHWMQWYLTDTSQSTLPLVYRHIILQSKCS